MSVEDKVVQAKKVISLVCDVVPLLVAIVKETILLLKTA